MTGFRSLCGPLLALLALAPSPAAGGVPNPAAYSAFFKISCLDGFAVDESRETAGPVSGQGAGTNGQGEAISITGSAVASEFQETPVSLTSVRLLNCTTTFLNTIGAFVQYDVAIEPDDPGAPTNIQISLHITLAGSGQVQTGGVEFQTESTGSINPGAVSSTQRRRRPAKDLNLRAELVDNGSENAAAASSTPSQGIRATMGTTARRTSA